ncbi:ABC transporter ATP-binding protein [Paenibacillus eucommiae]|uniref:ABC-2 type transport system ATP-binding protein n=1 Tax=Paenibacillus eucommiae TaxID=1355755 RepID=A0ABS4IXX1_9BACL|nr:ABC transporter ATP-binding protein [Paenibacillus eucommiae]MBP1992436.1 ABC-2 type transport system ATP-binding protein [Paenibacillus eucommiae]
MKTLDPLMSIRLRGLSKPLGKLTLGPLDLELEAGYFTAILGKNGSGKSTLFRLLMNMLKPEQGEIELLGAGYPLEEVALKRRIGYVPETMNWQEIECRTIKELTRLVSRWYPSWDKQRYDRLMTEFELQDNFKLEVLSKGMQRKLAFIYAISHNPDVLLLDEPSSGLDPFAWRIMMKEIGRFMESGNKTVLMATHILEEIKLMADYIVFMHDGQLLGKYEKDTLMDGWKAFWVGMSAYSKLQLPGVVQIEDSSPGSPGVVRLISDSPLETEAALNEHKINVISTKALELDEILSFLIRNGNKQQ